MLSSPRRLKPSRFSKRPVHSKQPMSRARPHDPSSVGLRRAAVCRGRWNTHHNSPSRQVTCRDPVGGLLDNPVPIRANTAPISRKRAAERVPARVCVSRFALRCLAGDTRAALGSAGCRPRLRAGARQHHNASSAPLFQNCIRICSRRIRSSIGWPARSTVRRSTSPGRASRITRAIVAAPVTGSPLMAVMTSPPSA